MIRLVDKRTIEHFNLFRAFSSMRCSDSTQKIAFDFSYGNEMRLVDQKYLASQIKMCYESNLKMDDPFHMYLCGLQPNTNQYSFLSKAAGVCSEVEFCFSLCV